MAAPKFSPLSEKHTLAMSQRQQLVAASPAESVEVLPSGAKLRPDLSFQLARGSE